MAVAFHKRREAPKPGCTFVAARDFVASGRSFKAGDVFPYAELGLVYAKAVNLWTAGRLKVVPQAAATPVAMQLTPGERVVVETPSQHRKRRRS